MPQPTICQYRLIIHYHHHLHHCTSAQIALDNCIAEGLPPTPDEDSLAHCGITMYDNGDIPCMLEQFCTFGRNDVTANRICNRATNGLVHPLVLAPRADPDYCCNSSAVYWNLIF